MTDINNLITDNIDVWTSAIKKKSATGRGTSKKIELMGIKKLRELILELAVSGKLVPQDSGDEQASVLLERIAEEKEQLIAVNKIKKEKDLPAIVDEEQPFKKPSGWAWSRMGDLAQFQKGYAFKSKDYLDSGCMITKIQNLTDNHTQNSAYIAPEKAMDFKQYLLSEGDIVMTTVGSWFSAPMSAVGRSFLINNLFDNSLLNQNAVRLSSWKELDPMYLYLCVNSPIFKRYLVEEAQGTANQASITQLSIKHFLICVPPLTEQHRIVTKANELMALCDQLEQQTEQSLTAHQTLVEVLLSSLFKPAEGSLLPSTAESTDGSATESKDVNDFQENWQRISEHFDVLFTTEHSIEQLKQTILQLAVMGKLVPQNPSDEPASVLLEKIAEEKAQLIADKKIKKQKPLPAITDEEKPFAQPSGWEWSNLVELITLMDAGWSPACPPEPSPSNDKWGVLKTTAVQSMQFLEHENKVLADSKEPRPQYEVKVGDILITRAGPKNRVGVSCLVQSTRPKLMISDKIIRFHLAEVGMCERYISLCLNAGETAEYLESAKSGMAESQMNISQDKLKAAPIPLCPIKEQYRIVAKVDELMALCEQLKARLSYAQTTQLHLADAVVENVLSAHATDT